MPIHVSSRAQALTVQEDAEVSLWAAATSCGADSMRVTETMARSYNRQVEGDWKCSAPVRLSPPWHAGAPQQGQLVARVLAAKQLIWALHPCLRHRDAEQSGECAQFGCGSVVAGKAAPPSPVSGSSGPEQRRLCMTVMGPRCHCLPAVLCFGTRRTAQPRSERPSCLMCRRTALSPHKWMCGRWAAHCELWLHHPVSTACC